MQNFHKHSHLTNPQITDSVVSNEDFCRRAVELGHKIISSCEHGTQGNYFECSELAQKYDLKWRYVTEAYFVKDRTPEAADKTNCHLILAAKTEKGKGDLNEALSEANISGFYFRPRVDMEILLSLDPKDVFVTSACLGGVWKYGYTENREAGTWNYNFTEPDRLVRQLHAHFGDSFMLEVQYHNVEKQKVINRHILDLYRREGIKMIVGLDSHYVYPEQEILRQMRLEANHLIYENEDGFFMDYPSDETVFERFKTQGVLSDAQIREAMDNTDIFLTFEDIVLDKSRKLPTIYPNLTQKQRNEKYRELIREKWKAFREDIPKEKWPQYLEGIKYEVDTITETNMSDYFLLDYEVVKRAKELGGVITRTGRGSGPSYFTNTLLGFSSVDRFALPVTMYPDRFISKDRLLSGSTPDLDLNTGTPEIIAKAQAEIMGEWHSAPMIAFGTLKRSSAWKMYCRAEKIPFEDANEVSEQLKRYEIAVKYAEDEEEAESINPYDYVPEQYHEVLRMSEKYLGLVERITPHACAYLVTNADIRREIGIYRINSKTGKKKIIYAAYIDGNTADRFGYLKNDDLKVDVVKVNAEIYNHIGIPQPSVRELLEMTDGDKPTWDMYAKGYTLGLNQCEKEKSTEKVMRYKPRNISEMSAFVAAIRPAFKSMIDIFLARKHFDYGIPVLDDLLQTEEMRSSFILYQEQMMKILQYAGFSAPASYASIKAIAKKHPEKVLPLKAQFLEGFSARLRENNVPEDQVNETSENVWKIISDACSYGFNSSHATSVALDSLYTAWAKAHHPYETYAALMTNYAEKGDKARIDRARVEMKQAFGITIAPCRFRQDNRTFFIDKENKTISDTLMSVKHVSKRAADELYGMRNNAYATFTDLLVDVQNRPALDTRVMDILIRMGYFSEFGSAGKLLKLKAAFEEGPMAHKKNLIDKTKEKRKAALYQFEASLEESELYFVDQLSFEAEHFGTPVSTYKDKRWEVVVLDVDEKYTPKVRLYNVAKGTIGVMRVKKAKFAACPVKKGDVLRIYEFDKRPARRYQGGKSVVDPDRFDIWLYEYTILPPQSASAA